jgi:hypothetical protein
MHQKEANLQEERIIERERYAVLLHLYTYGLLSQMEGIPGDRIMRDLGLRQARTDGLLRSLLLAEYLDYSGTGRGLLLTGKAVDYLEKGAGRRRSLRL